MTEIGGHNGSRMPIIADGLFYALFILVISMIVVPVVTGALFDAVIEGAPVSLSSAYKQTLRGGLGLIAQGAAMVGLTVHRVRRAGGFASPWASLGLDPSRAGRTWGGEAAVGLVAGVAVTAVNVIGSWLTQLLFGLFMDGERLAEQVAQESASIVELLGGGESLFIALLLPVVAVVVAPVSEEVFFRGYLYGVLRGRYTDDPWYAAYWSSAVFALVHFYVIHFIPVFLIGMVLAYLYRRRGSLVAPIVAHATANLIVTVTTIVSQSGL